MKIVKVQGNVKKGFDGEIGEKTLIVGPNGSGKSTIVNIVELALTGRVGDIAGKVDVAREVDVMSLATGDSLFATATFDDGKTAVYRTEGSTAKAKKAVRDLPGYLAHEDVLPIRTLREAVLGSPATARKFLLAKMGSDLNREIGAPGEHAALYWTLMNSIPLAISPADALVQVLETAASKAREASAAAKAAKQAANFVTQGAAIPPSKEEIKALREKAIEVQKQYAEVSKRQQPADPGKLDELTKRHSDLLATATVLADEINEQEGQLRILRQTLGVLNPDLDALLTTAHMSIEAGNCVICGAVVPDLADTVSRIEAEQTSYMEEVKQEKDLELAIQQAKTKLAGYVSSLERLEAELSALAQPVEEYTGPSAEELLAEHGRLTEKATDLSVKLSAWESARKAQAQAEESEENAAQWKALKDSLEEKVGLILEVARTKFILRVQSYLPNTDRFDLRLKDGDREVVQFGLVRGEQLHTALSGAEWARVMAALASACVPEGEYACIIPEERAFDAVTLGKVMRALGETPHQVILTSPVAPKSPPKDWVIIRRGEEE